MPVQRQLRHRWEEISATTEQSVKREGLKIKKGVDLQARLC